MNSKFKGLLNLKKINFILNIDNIINFLKLKKQNSSYFTSTEFVVVPEPYRTLTKLLSQNSQKLFDRNLSWIYCLIELNSLCQNSILCLISVDYFLIILIRKIDSSTVRIRFGDKFGIYWHYWEWGRIKNWPDILGKGYSILNQIYCDL